MTDQQDCLLTDDTTEVETPTYFAPSALLAELKAKAQEPKPDVLSDRLPLSAIKPLPGLFQPRGTDERHIQELLRGIRNNGDLEPMVVVQVGGQAYLIDGHHRTAAYELAGVAEPVPVRYFGGTIEEAVLEAGRANSKAKLPMTTQERQEYAWRLVLMGTFSKKQVREAACVSDGQVANMRRVKKLLGEDAYDCRNWKHAQQMAKGIEGQPMSDDEMEQWLAAQAAEWADRLSKEFGTKLANNTELAARALYVHFGRRLPDLVEHLSAYVPEGNRYEDEDESDF